ncbi:MAG: aminotransferase class V-fold PLP-dependent enzyme [Thermoanaerobaculaceae bacterium]
MDLSQLLPLREHWLYLDHASQAPLPRPTTEAMQQVIAAQRESAFWQSRELEQLDQRVRALLAQALGCQVTEIGLFPDRYVALLSLFAGLSPQSPGQVLLAGEEPEDLEPLAKLLADFGHRVRLLAPVRFSQLAGALFSQLAEVDVALLPWVDETGWVLELDGLAKALGNQRPTLFLDATQALPCRPETFSEIDADAVLLPSHTWFLGPRGLAAVVSREELRRKLRPILPPHRKATPVGLSDAACFEGQALPPAVLAGFAASLELFLSLGLGEVRKRIWAHQRTLTTHLLELGWAVGSPGAAHSVAGIVVAQHPFFPAQEVQARLAQRRVRVGVLGEWVRFSPHFYTTIAEIEALRQILAKL